KKPTSSKIKEMIISATNVKVAFQTMPVTSQTSPRSTTPTSKATAAPAIADQPIDKFRGWAITKNKVMIKIITANQTSTFFTTPYSQTTFFPSAFNVSIVRSGSGSKLNR